MHSQSNGHGERCAWTGSSQTSWTRRPIRSRGALMAQLVDHDPAVRLGHHELRILHPAEPGERPEDQIHLYGCAAGPALADGNIEVQRIVEKPPKGTAPSNLAVIGRYLLPPDVFGILERIKAGAGGEIQLTDALAVLAQQKRLLGVRFKGERHDAGDRLGYLQANIAYALHRPELREGLLAYLRKVLP